MASGHSVVTIAVPCEFSPQRRALDSRLLRKLQEAMPTQTQIPLSPMSASSKYDAVVLLEQQIPQIARIILKP